MLVLARYNADVADTSTASRPSNAGSSAEGFNYTPPIFLSNEGADKFKLQSLNLPPPNCPIRPRKPRTIPSNSTPVLEQAPIDDSTTAMARSVAQEVIRKRSIRSKNKQKLESSSQSKKRE